MTPAEPVTGLILSGGGARAAYQVGVLTAIAELLPDGGRNPFPVIVGTSAGSMIAALCASGIPPWFMVAHSRGEIFDGLVGPDGRPAADADRSAGAPRAVGVSVAGLVDRAGERYLFGAHLPWRDAPLRRPSVRFCTRNGSQKIGIVTFHGAFHGRTMGALSVTGSKTIQRRGFGPLVVAMDSHGGSLYARTKSAARERRAGPLPRPSRWLTFSFTSAMSSSFLDNTY